jgi:hypothetical protein
MIHSGLHCFSFSQRWFSSIHHHDETDEQNVTGMERREPEIRVSCGVLFGRVANATATMAPIISTGTIHAIGRTSEIERLAAIFRVEGRIPHEPIVKAANVSGAIHSPIGLPVNSSDAPAPR